MTAGSARVRFGPHDKETFIDIDATTPMHPAGTLGRIGAFLLRYGLVLIFLWFGMLKFTAYEAEGIAPLAMHSPLLSWAFAALGKQGLSNAIGAIELAVGALIALRAWSPRASAIGSIGAVITFFITLSFLLSTPGVWQEGMGFPFLSGMVGQFLIKDLVLLAASVWTAAEALRAAEAPAPRSFVSAGRNAPGHA